MHAAIRSLIAVCAFSGTIAVAPSAAANVVTFDTLSGPNGTTFTSITEDGITVNSLSGLWQHGFFVGNPIPSIFTFDRVSSIEVLTGGLFNFASFDLGTGGVSNPSYAYQGYLDNVLVFAGGGTPGGDAFTTIANDFAGQAIDRLVIVTTLTSSSANIDNIVVNAARAVPEPATLALLGIAFASLALRSRAAQA